MTLAGLVGARGKTWGLDHFGYSAPAKVLDEKLGFTPANVCNQVVKYLADYQQERDRAVAARTGRSHAAGAQRELSTNRSLTSKAKHHGMQESEQCAVL